MKYARLLLLLLPFSVFADNVQYTFYGDGATASLIAPGFLPDLPARSSTPNLIPLYPEDFLYSPCPALAQGGFLQCTGISVSYGQLGGIAIFDIEYGSIHQQPGDPFYVNGQLMQAYGYTDLRQIGTFGNPGEQTGIIVNYTTAPVTYAPEPRSWVLLLVGTVAGCVLAGTQKRRQVSRS